MSKKAKVASVVVTLVIIAGVAVGYVVKAKADRRGASGPPAAVDAAANGIKTAVAPDAGLEPAKTGSSKVIAYYFHRTVRCHTCLAIEDLSKQTIENLFGEQLAEGRIEWRPVNIEQKGNEHFEDDYKLTTQSLVLVKLVDGKQADWKNLTSVWDLIDNHEKFVKYVQEELSKYIRS